MSDLKKEVGHRLKKAREKKGLKQNRVANSLGIHNSTLAKYESGEREADNETLNKLADMYDVTPTWILTGSTTNDQAMNDVMKAYDRLPQHKKKLVDDVIRALMDEDKQ